MMSPESIRYENHKRSTEAAAKNKQPWIFEEEDRGVLDAVRGIPNIGDYEPEGWEQVRDLFVDSSGFGASHEPALTIDAFLQEMVPGMGYAITSTGQFQIYITEYRRQEQ